MGAVKLTEERMPLKPLIRLRIEEYNSINKPKFSRSKAAEELGMSYSHLANVIAGTQQTTPEKLWILAKMLGCKVDDLYVYEN